MKRIILLAAIFIFSLNSTDVQSQIPAGYYDSAAGLTGPALKAALHKIIRNHAVRSYSQLWIDFQTTDKDSTGNVWDMYSNCVFVFITDQCGGYSAECNCYNREHSMPNSWWGGTQDTMYSDLFHLVPTDGWVNNKRGNYPFGEVTSPSYTSGNGSKLGTCSFPGYSGTVFEPVDEYKGDFARNYFYLATRYENRISSWTSDMLAGNSYPVFTTWAVNLLLKWSHQDTVSKKEIDRNNAIYGLQHNRNPFIDHPEWIDVIWSTTLNVFTLSDKDTICKGLSATISAYPGGGTGAYTYSWSNGAGNSSSITVSPDSTTSYTVTVSDGTNTTTSSVVVHVKVCSGMDEYDKGGMISIYPNPATDKVFYEYDSNTNENMEITLWSDDGRKIIEKHIEKYAGKYSSTIDLKGISKGVYYLVFVSDNNNYIKKLIIQ